MAEVKAVSRTEAIQNGDEVKPVSREEYFLKKSVSGGGSGGAGYTVETQSVAVVPEQTAITMVVPESRPFASAQINLAEGITSVDDVPDTLTIVFNGTEYECDANIVGDNKVYGGFNGSEVDFSQYPFVVNFRYSDDLLISMLVTESAGTYTVKAERVLETVTVSEDFTKASVKAVGIPEYTFDDVGKVLTVATGYKTVDTIHEQSVTILAGTSRANLSDVSGNTYNIYINGEKARHSISGAYECSTFVFEIDRSASPATIIYGIIVPGKTETDGKFVETNADEDTTFTIRGTGSVEAPVLRWAILAKSGDSSSDDGKSTPITPKG